MTEALGTRALYCETSRLKSSITYMLCYPTQVASLDGRVKLIGAEGVESMLICEPRGSTKLLEFVVDRDILLRVSEVRLRAI